MSKTEEYQRDSDFRFLHTNKAIMINITQCLQKIHIDQLEQNRVHKHEYLELQPSDIYRNRGKKYIHGRKDIIFNNGARKTVYPSEKRMKLSKIYQLTQKLDENEYTISIWNPKY